MTRQIPEGSVEIQTGLWLYSYKETISGTEYTFRELFSSEGYYFYDNTLPEEERIYCQWMSLAMVADVNDYTSIPESELPDNANIASAKPEIA